MGISIHIEDVSKEQPEALWRTGMYLMDMAVEGGYEVEDDAPAASCDESGFAVSKETQREIYRAEGFLPDAADETPVSINLTVVPPLHEDDIIRTAGFGVGRAEPDAAVSVPPPPPPSSELDSRGFPWDARIHGRTKAKIGDGTWRYRRGSTDEEIAMVEAELRQTMGAGHKNVLAVLPTGGGKTVIFSSIVGENKGAAVAIAHRAELVSQMSLALARNGVRHKVIGPATLARNCTGLHLTELSKNFIDPHSRIAVASVDTLVRRDANEAWFKEVSLWVTDEAAHLLSTNKWGDAVAMFPNARGLGVTATPTRADGLGLGAHADGVMHTMIEGPTMRDLINAGWLTDYRIFAPPSDLDLSSVTISANGDYSPPKLAAAVHKSHITGDVVQHYLKIASGKLGATFCVDVENATEIAAAYRQAGVPAEVISAKTPDALRLDILRKFRNREVLQLVSVDIFSEGFDLPAIEVISMARPTQSYGLYVQQFGRGVRPMEGKAHAILIDHVNNVIRHGLPDAPRQWSLDRRERKARSTPDDVVPIRVCVKCLSAYERVLPACPFCGEAHVPATRGTPEAVEGDLHEMEPELLARLRGEVAAVGMAPKIPYGAAPAVAGSIRKNHRLRIEALGSLGLAMAVWGGWREMEGDTVQMQQRRFFHQFGIDSLSAQALGRADAEALEGKIRDVLQRANIRVDASVSVE